MWKFDDICDEMNPLDIGGSEFVFHLDGEINRDGRHRICTFYWRWRNPTTIYFYRCRTRQLKACCGREVATFVKYLLRAKLFVVKNCSCQGFTLCSDRVSFWIIALPAFKLSRWEVAMFVCQAPQRRSDGSVGMALVLPALTDCRWWFESLLVHSGVSSATGRKATGADHQKKIVCQVPQLSGFKLWGGHVCLQYLLQVEICGCLLLKCCAYHGFKL